MFWLKIAFAFAVTISAFALPFWLIFGFSLPVALFISLAWLVGVAPAALTLTIVASLLGDAARLVITACERLPR
ncbi:MAG: hypothetical protein WAP51_04020 [Candidatus Sungiibacteriota bacterium]